MSGPTGIQLSPDGESLYVIDALTDALFRIDIGTGDRTVLSSATVGSGTNFAIGYGVAVNSAETVAYVCDISLDAVLAVDLATGNRTILSDASNGTGTSFAAPYDVTINSLGTKLYVADVNEDVIATL